MNRGLMAGMKTETHEKYALCIIPVPNPDLPGSVTKDTLNSFWQNVQTPELKKGGTLQLTENVWQIPLGSKLTSLGTLTHAAGVSGMPIRVLFLEETPNWIKSPQDATVSDQKN